MTKHHFDYKRFILSKTVLLFLSIIFGMLTLVSLRVHPIIASICFVVFVVFFSVLIEKERVIKLLDKKFNNR